MAIPPEPIETLSYQKPGPRARIDGGLAMICALSAAVVTLVLFFVVPRAQAQYENWRSPLPGITVALLGFARFCRGGGIVVVWLLAALPPVLIRNQGGPRRAFRPARLLVTLIMTGLFLWMIMALFLPYIAYLDSLSDSNVRH